MRISHFLAQKHGFFEIYGTSERTRGKGGVNQCGHFSNKGGRGQFFTILCGRLLWTSLLIQYLFKNLKQNC